MRGMLCKWLYYSSAIKLNLTFYILSDDLPAAGERAFEKWRQDILRCLTAVESRMDEEQRKKYLALQQAGGSVKRSPIRLVTDEGHLDFSVLVTERRAHETAEAHASVTWRYQQSLLGDSGTNNRKPIQTADKQGPTELGGTTALKTKLVNEIVRVRQAFEEAKKRAGSGLERRNRWLGSVGASSAARPGGTRLSDIFAVTQGDLKSKRKSFAALEDRLIPSWPLAKAGIDTQSPLQPGSGVLVVHQDELFYGIGTSQPSSVSLETHKYHLFPQLSLFTSAGMARPRPTTMLINARRSIDYLDLSYRFTPPLPPYNGIRRGSQPSDFRQVRFLLPVTYFSNRRILFSLWTVYLSLPPPMTSLGQAHL